MDDRRFDALTRALAAPQSRRRAARALLVGAGGGALAALGLAGPTRAQQAKRPLCHATGDPANPWVVISVAEPAWDTHFAHGDHPFGDCCADADCGAGLTCVGGVCAAVGCRSAADCDDHNPCTTDTCVAGQCRNVPHTFCDDNLRCTRDTCVPDPIDSSRFHCDWVVDTTACGPLASCQRALCGVGSDCQIVDTCVPTSEGCDGCAQCSCDTDQNRCVKACTS